MATKSSLPRPKPQDREKHPPDVAASLNPNLAAVRTSGTPGATEPRTRPASELKDVVRALVGFSSDELRQIPVVIPGARLKPEATYIDLRAPDRGTFSAPDESYAGKDAWFVAKTDVPPPLWNRLREAGAVKPAGRDNPTRSVAQGESRPQGGRERAERRGSSSLRSVQAPARHHRARGH